MRYRIPPHLYDRVRHVLKTLTNDAFGIASKNGGHIGNEAAKAYDDFLNSEIQFMQLLYACHHHNAVQAMRAAGVSGRR